MDGQGRLSMPDGSVFEGQFQNGKFHGHGVYCWSDGSKYEGMKLIFYVRKLCPSLTAVSY